MDALNFNVNNMCKELNERKKIFLNWLCNFESIISLQHHSVCLDITIISPLVIRANRNNDIQSKSPRQYTISVLVKHMGWYNSFFPC